MKLTGKTIHNTTITGEISRGEIEALIRQRVNVPEGADLLMFVRDLDNLDGPELVYIREAEGDLAEVPLRFTIAFSGEVRHSPVPLETPTEAEPEAPPPQRFIDPSR